MKLVFTLFGSLGAPNERQMHTDLKIKIPKDPNARSYIEFYFHGKRIREYTGQSILLDIEPNRSDNAGRKLELLYELKASLLKHLIADDYPAKKVTAIAAEPIKAYSLMESLQLALSSKLNMKLSKQYKGDLVQIHTQFLEFLNKVELDSSLSLLKLQRLEEFLSRFNSSGTYYMKKRNDLSILLSLAAKLTGELQLQEIPTLKGVRPPYIRLMIKNN